METKATEKRNYAKRYSEAEVNEMIAKAVKQAIEKTQTQNQSQVVMKKQEYVTIVYLGAIAKGTVVFLGSKLGSLNRAGVPRDVPKDDFLQSLGIPVVDNLLRKKSLIVLDGLTEEEKERFNITYKEGELLTKEAFFKLFDYSPKEVCAIFEKACLEHKELIAKLFYTAYFQDRDSRINYETIKALNDCSKTIKKEGLFAPILESITKAMAQ